MEQIKSNFDPVAMRLQREKTDEACRAAALKAMEKKHVERPRVSIKNLAARLGMDVSACRRYVLRLGYKPLKQRMPDSGFQLALTVTAAEAFEIQAARAKDGYCAAP